MQEEGRLERVGFQFPYFASTSYLHYFSLAINVQAEPAWVKTTGEAAAETA